MDNSLNDDNYCALLAYTRYICAYWDKPLQQGIGLLQQYRASTMGHSAPGEIIPSDNQPTRFLQRSEQTSGLAPSIARYPVAPYPPTAENLPRAQTQAPNDPSTSPYQSNQKQANNAAFSVASTPGLQSGVPGTVNPASGGVSSPQIGCLGPSNKYAEYDPLWVDRQDEVSRVALANLKSVFSFDDLFRFRVIKPQDAIVLHNIATYHRKEPGHHRWEDAPIRLTVLRYSQTFTPNKSVPDFAVTVLNCPEVRCPDIKACSDLDDIFKNIDELPVTVSKNGTKFWEKSQVFRAGQNLGSLDWMKSSFHVWKELKDCEGVESRIWKVLKVCEEMGE